MSKLNERTNVRVRQDNSKPSSIWGRWVPQCGNPRCPTKSLTRALTHRRGGMKIDDRWYCSAECFEQTVRDKIEELITSEGKPARAHSSRLPMGLLLLSREILTSEQLKLALVHQQLAGVDFGAAVQELGFATQEQVTAAVAAQWACPVYSLGDRLPPMPMRIPRQLLDRYEMLPVHYAESERRLLMGFVRGVHHQILSTIEHMTSCTAAACFITGREYNSHLNSPSTTFTSDHEMVSDQIVGSGEMARITATYAGQMTAERMRLGICRDYLWARIWGRQQELDLLFRV